MTAQTRSVLKGYFTRGLRPTQSNYEDLIDSFALISTSADYVAKSGDTMTGLLILSGNPSAALGAATKQYADAVVSGYATLASPAFTGTPSLPTGTTGITQSSTDNSTKLATTAFVSTAISNASPKNHITGFTPSNIAGTNTTATLTVATGQATDSTGVSLITKATTTSWAVTNGNAINGYSGGTTLPNSSTIHFYICTGATGTGVYAIPNSSYPLAAASAPSGYNSYVRRIFSLNTTGAGALIAGTAIETDGGGLLFYLTTALTDINTATLGTSSTLYTLTTPLGIKTQLLYRTIISGTAGTNVIITSPDETDAAPVYPTSGTPASDMNYYGTGSIGVSFARDGILTTNTSGQIRARASNASTTLVLTTRGFLDFRRD